MVIILQDRIHHPLLWHGAGQRFPFQLPTGLRDSRATVFFRSLDRESLPNADLIRNADVVWIQANSLAHKHYYKIIDIVRKYNKPVRYFAYASATKCAEQIVLEDRGE